MTAEEIMTTPIEFKSIEAIQQHQFYGNHAFDHQAFSAIHRFVENDQNSLQDRAEAIRIMSDRGMGCGRVPEKTDAELVAEHH